MVKPIERILRSGNFGPWDRPDIPGLDPLPSGDQPRPAPHLGARLVPVLPELHDGGVGARLVPHLPLLADGIQPAHLRGHAVLAPAKTARDRMRQELTAVTFKEFGLQDSGTHEATQTVLESRAVSQFPLNDQELLLRNLHKTAGDYVAAYEAHEDPPHAGRRLRLAGTTGWACPVSSLLSLPTWSRSRAGRCRPDGALRQTTLEHHGRAPGVLRRRSASPRGRRSTSRGCPWTTCQMTPPRSSSFATR